jgi:hypothetical protein
MAELLIPQDDGTYTSIKVEISGVGVVTNPVPAEGEPNG